MEIECHFDLTAALEREWEDFLGGTQHAHPRQYIPFAKEEMARGRATLFAIGRVENKVKATALISLEPHPFLHGYWSRGICKSGPVCDDIETMSAFLKKLIAHASTSRIGRLHITPYWLESQAIEISKILSSEGWALTENNKFRTTGIIDLTASVDQIFDGMSKSARREVRRTKRQGVEFRPAASRDEALVFLHSLNRLYSGRGLPIIDEIGFCAAFESVFKLQDIGVLILAWRENTFLAGIMALRSQKTVHGSQFTNEPSCLRETGNLRIAPATWLEAIKWGQAKGCDALDFEGYKAPRVGEQKFHIYKYKSEFNPKEILRVSEHAIVINNFCHLSGGSLFSLGSKISKLRKISSGFKRRL